jgi:hypothetical protein
MTGEGFGHAVLAGAVGGSSIACGAATGPLLATVFEVAAAAVTAGIAAHAVELSARERGVSSAGVLHRAARRAIKRSGAPLAAHATDVMCRTLAGDRRALRSAAILLGRATSTHARGLALQLFGAWRPLRELSQLGALMGAPRAAQAALENAAFVSEMVGAVRETSGVPAAITVSDRFAVPPASSATRVATEAEPCPDTFTLTRDRQDREDREDREDWGVAA